MIPYLFAQLLVYAAVATIAVVSNRDYLEWQTWGYGTKPALLLGLLPILGAWAACELLRLARPVRLLDLRISGLFGRFATGIGAGVIGFVLTLLAVEFINGVWWEATLTTGAGFLAAGLVALFSSRIRPGRCTQCQYDLASITTATRGKCPECGSSLCGA
ncbi:MAG: hypothetical protein ACREJO_02075 [Phycisphaerales bacterium]